MDATSVPSMQSHIAEINADLCDLAEVVANRPLGRIELKASERLIQTLAEACIGIAKHRCKQLGYPAPENAYMALNACHRKTLRPSIFWSGGGLSACAMRWCMTI
jgi:uncharacterized protein YutE (UPF0331/DUF86 family)